MKTLPHQLQQRVAQALCVFAILAVAPWLVAQVAPSLSAFVPPFFLTIVVVFTIVDALILWCPRWFFGQLFPDQPLPASLPLSGQSLRHHRIAVFVSTSVSCILAFRWVQSLS